MHAPLLIRLYLVTLTLVCLQGSWPRVAGFLAPAPPPPTAAEAGRAYQAGDFEGALRLYEALLRLHPEDDQARRDRARVLRQSGRPEEAREQLAILRARRPLDPSLALQAAETALLADRPEEALRELGALAAAEAGDAGVLPGGGGMDTPGEDASSEDPRAEALYLRGLALLDLGRRGEAAGALADSLARQAFRPQAWYQAGLLHLERGQRAGAGVEDTAGAEAARAALQRALQQEPNLTQAFHPLALAWLALGEQARAHGLLQRALAARPADPDLAALLERVEVAFPELAREERRARAADLARALPRRGEGVPADRESLPSVRIGLVEKATQLELKPGARFTLSAGSAGARRSGRAGTLLRVRQAEGGLEVLDAAGRRLLRSAAPVLLTLADPAPAVSSAPATLLFGVHFGEGSFWAGSEDRSYRGDIELLPRPEGLTAVNRLSIEEYLYSVLPSEMPAGWPAAALRAQAIAARTYTLANLGQYAARGFNLLGSVASAAYRGTGSEASAAREAVDATQGRVLLRDGKPLPTFYSANSGGHTETTEAVWGGVTSLPAASDLLLPPRPAPLSPDRLARWLAARPPSFSSAPGFSSPSAYRWTQWVPRRELESRLGLEESVGSIRALVTTRPGISGRVREVRIVGTLGERVIRGDALRSRLGGLRSNLFVVEPRLGADGLPEAFLFTGGGWGHGVGLCQSGAAGMAAAGYTAEEILGHYYGGAEPGLLP